MKKLYSFLAIAILSTGAFAQTPTVVVNETFSYTGLLNANGWVTHSGTPGQISSDGSVASIYAGNSEDVNLAFTTPYTVSPTAANNKVTYSATLNVPNGTGLSTSGDYCLTLGGTAGAGLTTLYGRLFIKGSAAGYTLGILNTSGAPATPTYGTEIPYGTPANIVVEYLIDNAAATKTNIATLQINSQPLISNSSGTNAAPSALASIAIRQAGNANSGTGNVTFDNIVVTTYSTSLAVTDLVNTSSNFVKNTFIDSDINFGAKADVKIFSMNGQVVKSASVSENKSMNVADLAPGMYIVTGMVNGEAVSQKIMKK